jgi:hypothetical protein
MCIMCALMRLSLSLLCSPSWSKCARFVISSSSTVLRCSFSEGKSAATLCVLLQSAHLPCMYTRERGACMRESTKLLLSALGSIFTFVYFCQLALCVCVLRWTHSRSPAPGFNFLENSFCVSHLCIERWWWWLSLQKGFPWVEFGALSLIWARNLVCLI